jgi:hypothetical protein
MRSVRAPLRAALVVLLLVNALDLSTSLLPNLIDTVAMPRRSTGALIVQLLLLVPLAAGAVRALPSFARALWRLPIPRIPLVVVVALVVLQLLHGALRMEAYPFSNVGMFSSVAVEPTPLHYVGRFYLIGDSHSDGGRKPLSFLREGNPLFARYFHDLDYKAAWALGMYKGSPEVDRIVADTLRAADAPAAHLQRTYWRDFAPAPPQLSQR